MGDARDDLLAVLPPLGHQDDHGRQQQLRHLSKLLLAAMIILMTEKVQDSRQVISRISNLANRPELDKILEPKG